MAERVGHEVYRADAIRFPNVISVLLVESGDGWTLFVTGIKSSAGRIREALTALVETGGPEVSTPHSPPLGPHRRRPTKRARRASDAELVAQEREAEVISGRPGSSLPSNALLRYASRYQKLLTSPIDSVAREDEVGVTGFRIVLTPGHTLGYVSLLRNEYDLFFVGERVWDSAAQNANCNIQGALHRSPVSEALSREGAPKGARYCGHEPWQNAVRRRATTTLGSARPLRRRIKVAY